jgi:peptidoglycan/LPS O-acetylase OafA/YrhL
MSISSVSKNLMAWIDERFPISQGIFISVLVATAVFYGQIVSQSEPLEIGLKEVMSFLSCWALFLLLRILDEHKDYLEDLNNYPERVLQSGRITLLQLKVVGVFAIILQASYSVLVDQGIGYVTYYWLLTMLWTFFMTVEFFVPVWLNKNQIIYGLSHMTIIVFILAWLMQVGAGEANISELGQATLWLLLMAFFAGCSYELTRKAWGLEEEKATVTSYRRILGNQGVAIAIVLTLAVAISMSQMIVSMINPDAGLWTFIFQLAVWITVAIVLVRYVKNPSTATRKMNEAVVGVCMLIIYLMPLIVMIQLRGIK